MKKMSLVLVWMVGLIALIANAANIKDGTLDDVYCNEAPWALNMVIVSDVASKPVCPGGDKGFYKNGLCTMQVICSYYSEELKKAAEEAYGKKFADIPVDDKKAFLFDGNATLASPGFPAMRPQAFKSTTGNVPKPLKSKPAVEMLLAGLSCEALSPATAEAPAKCPMPQQCKNDLRMVTQANNVGSIKDVNGIIERFQKSESEVYPYGEQNRGGVQAK